MRRNDPRPQNAVYRSRRVYYAGNGWYIGTREGERGPFPSKRVAILELRHYLRSFREVTHES